MLAWKSKLQTTISSSSKEAEYVSLSQSMRDKIPIMDLLEELTKKDIILKAAGTTDAKVKCKAFKDNVGAIKLARLPLLRPFTKHKNIGYHHIRSYVANGTVIIEPIATMTK